MKPSRFVTSRQRWIFSDLRSLWGNHARHTSILHHNDVYNHRDRDPHQALCAEATPTSGQAALTNPHAGPYCPLSNFGSFPILLEPSRVIGNVRTMISSITPWSLDASVRLTLTGRADVYDIPVDNIHLEHGDRTLHNTDTLEDHGIEYSSVTTVCTSGLSPRKRC